MSGPVTAADAAVDREASQVVSDALEITESRDGTVGSYRVRRALPRRGRRTVGRLVLRRITWDRPR